MKVTMMLVFRYPPMMTLHGCQTKLELYTDRIIICPTGWRATWFPLVFGEARMLYLDEVTGVWLCPLRFRPTLKFKLVIRSRSLPDVSTEYLETEYKVANQIIDYIENYLGQGAFPPPASV